MKIYLKEEEDRVCRDVCRSRGEGIGRKVRCSLLSVVFDALYILFFAFCGDIFLSY